MAFTDKVVCFALVMLLCIGVCTAARTLMDVEGYGAGGKNAAAEDGKKPCGGDAVGGGIGNSDEGVGDDGVRAGPTGNGNSEGIVGAVVGNTVGPRGNGNAAGVAGAVGPTGNGNAKDVVGTAVSQAVGPTSNGNAGGVVGTVASQGAGPTGNGNAGGVIGAKATGVAVKPIDNGQAAVGQTKGFGRPEGFVAGKGVNLGGTPSSSASTRNGVGDGGLVGNVVGKPLHG